MNELENENSILHFENAQLRSKLHNRFWFGLIIGVLIGWLI